MHRKRRGFTLIELIIVIVIIGILAVIAIPAYFANIQKARRAEAVSTLNAIRQAEIAYYATQSPPAYTINFPITATMDGDTIVSLARPISPNFTYGLTTVGDPCIDATLVAGSGGSTSYSMLTSTGKISQNATCT